MIGLERDAGRFRLAAVAARLGITTRTRQRLIAHTGKTYSALKAEADREAAMELLGRQGLSVTESLFD